MKLQELTEMASSQQPKIDDYYVTSTTFGLQKIKKVENNKISVVGNDRNNHLQIPISDLHLMNQAEKLLLTAHIRNKEGGGVENKSEIQPEKASNWLWAKTAPISYWILMFVLACLGGFAIYMTYLYGKNPDTAIDLIDKILAHRFNPF